uniref:(northern house mosquito) hypothetical protein n=1 Tax=Culex pipiens TaxID=7175 RepID=A0A8D8FFR7_CULPI
MWNMLVKLIQLSCIEGKEEERDDRRWQREESELTDYGEGEYRQSRKTGKLAGMTEELVLANPFALEEDEENDFDRYSELEYDDDEDDEDLQYSGGQTSPTGRHQLSTASSYGQQQIKLESLPSPTRAFRLEPADEVELPPPPPPAVVRSSAVVPDGGRHPSVIYETSSSSRYDGGLSSFRQNQQQHHPEQQLPNNGNLQQQEIEYLQKGAAVTAAKRKRDTDLDSERFVPCQCKVVKI